MIDLHTHSLLSDGCLVPSELARRAEEKGCSVIGITDHVDFSNLEFVIKAVREAADHINKSEGKIKVIPGVEITHVAPSDIPVIVKSARDLGAALVVVHGETIVEPVSKGTNRKALESGIDILAHPGIMSRDDAKLAADCGISVELTARKGHSLSNGHNALLWYEFGFPMVLNTDTHLPENLIDDSFAEKVIVSAGIRQEDVKKILDNSAALAGKLLKG